MKLFKLKSISLEVYSTNGDLTHNIVTITDQLSSTALVIRETSGERETLNDSTYYIKKEFYDQEIVMSTISEKTFLTVMPGTSPTHSHPIIVNIYRM
jgi:hypothetical protein